MDPCSTTATASSIRPSATSKTGKIKLRKPLVEKMRRDRINNCIQQLKIILEKEFHKQEPNSRLEKAEILEMTVRFLRQQLCQDHLQPGWRDSLHRLSADSSVSPSLRLQQQQDLHQAFISSHTSCSGYSCNSSNSCSSRDPVWRPW